MKKILVVEDSRITQMYYGDVLDESSFEFDTASDGFEAVELVQQNTYDVILMDIRMPNMGGLEASRLIREILPTSEQPFIFAVTGKTYTEDITRYLAAGMNDIIEKPFSPDNLISALTNILSGAIKIRQVPGINIDLDNQSTELADVGIDRQVYQNLQALMGKEDVSQTLEIYLEEISNKMIDLKNAINENKHSALRKTAYILAMKSSVLGVSKIAAIFTDLIIMELPFDSENANKKIVMIEELIEKIKKFSDEQRLISNDGEL